MARHVPHSKEQMEVRRYGPPSPSRLQQHSHYFSEFVAAHALLVIKINRCIAIPEFSWSHDMILLAIVLICVIHL